MCTGDSHTASTSLLVRVRRRDPEAWRTLTQIYGPLAYGWARGAGLQAADAADVVQDGFLAGELPEPRLETICEHVNTCASCQDTVCILAEAEPPDASLSAVPPPDEGFHDEPECRQVGDELAALAEAPTFRLRDSDSASADEGSSAQDSFLSDRAREALHIPRESGRYRIMRPLG